MEDGEGHLYVQKQITTKHSTWNWVKPRVPFWHYSQTRFLLQHALLIYCRFSSLLSQTQKEFIYTLAQYVSTFQY